MLGSLYEDFKSNILKYFETCKKEIKVYYEILNYFIVGHMQWCIISSRYINN